MENNNNEPFTKRDYIIMGVIIAACAIVLLCIGLVFGWS